MGRKKAEVAAAAIDEEVDFSRPSRAMEYINKTFGNVCINGSRIAEEEREVVTTGSPALDAALGGGLMTGSCVTIAGDAGCGKTTTVMSMAAVWQALGRRVHYLSAEGRFYSMNLKGIDGLDPNKIEVTSHSEDCIMTAEKFLEAGEWILKNERNTMLIIDSLSILTTNAEFELKDFEKEARLGGSTKLVSSFCRRVTPFVPVRKNLVVGIAQVYTNIGGRKKFAVSMAKKAEFFRSTGIECEWVEFLQKDGDKKAWGQRVHWKVERSPLGAPKGKAESIIRYGRGIDREYEYVEQAADLGLISQKGAYYYMDFVGEDSPACQGMDKACQYLRDNPESYDVLKDRIRYYTAPEK